MAFHRTEWSHSLRETKATTADPNLPNLIKRGFTWPLQCAAYKRTVTRLSAKNQLKVVGLGSRGVVM